MAKEVFAFLRAEVGNDATDPTQEARDGILRDLDKALISLPPERTKNKREHIIPLSTAALDTLTIGKWFVFGTSGRAGFQNWTISKRRLDAKIAASGVANRAVGAA